VQQLPTPSAIELKGSVGSVKLTADVAAGGALIALLGLLFVLFFALRQ
jgi:hypothetical protein